MWLSLPFTLVQERDATRTAVTSGVEDSALHAMKAVAYAEQLRMEARAERERLAQEKRLTHNQKARPPAAPVAGRCAVADHDR